MSQPQTSASEQPDFTPETTSPAPPSSPQAARRILFSLMFPAMLMPMVSTMSRVALPVIRSTFEIQADVTAWVATVLFLPFMILMPVYGRLGDGLDKRHLLLLGLTVFSLGTAVTVFSTTIAWLMVGRAVQGIGMAGMIPLGMAMIATLFRVEERGKALGTWSTIGPTTGFLGPLSAGFLVAAWGWRGAFVPPLLFGLLALLAVYRGIPSRPVLTSPRFLRAFDWVGVVLLSVALTGFIFFLSSRSITGIAPFRDWRLLAAALLFLAGFIWREQHHANPFIPLHIFSNKMFSRTSFCASMRMFGMGGLGFLMPLYLVDIHGLPPAQLGGMLMINAGAMALIVRFGGGMSDRWSSRWLVIIGLVVQASVLVAFSWLPENITLLAIIALLAVHGLGVGLMLAALHHAVMRNIPEARLGAAAGLYSMLRFLGAVIGTTLSGVLLQANLDASLPVIEAYQNVFFLFAGFPILGLLVGFSLREPKTV
ncbi:MAG: MFS transporter [bacterium]|nr:MFS transporter [bacterium]